MTTTPPDDYLDTEFEAEDYARFRDAVGQTMTTNVRKATETAYEGIWEQYEAWVRTLLTDAHTGLLASSGADGSDSSVMEFESRRDEFLDHGLEVTKERLGYLFFTAVANFWPDGADDLSVMLMRSIWSFNPEEDARSVLVEAGLLSKEVE